jgi:hypothetical protein
VRVGNLVGDVAVEIHLDTAVNLAGDEQVTRQFDMAVISRNYDCRIRFNISDDIHLS